MGRKLNEVTYEVWAAWPGRTKLLFERDGLGQAARDAAEALEDPTCLRSWINFSVTIATRVRKPDPARVECDCADSRIHSVADHLANRIP